MVYDNVIMPFLFCTLPGNNIIAPENGLLDYDRFLFGMDYFHRENCC